MNVRNDKAGVFRPLGDEPYFRGHFPGNPVVPMTTMAAAMTEYAFLGHNGIKVVTGLSVTSRGIVKPGDEVVITVERLDKRESLGGFPAIYGKFLSSVGDKVVAEAIIEGHVLPDGRREFNPIRRPPVNIGPATVFADEETVMRILPHRKPMLLIGSILNWEDFGIGTVFQPTDDFPFTEQWPGTDMKVVPIWALAEAMGQEGIAYLSHNQWPDTPVGTLATGLSIRQFQPVLTGDRVMLKLELRRPLKNTRGTYFGKGTATAYLPATGTVAAVMECMASITPPLSA